MKKLAIITSILGIYAFQANAADTKTGFYVTGKLGTSIVTAHDSQSKFADNGNLWNSTNISNKNKGVFGGGLAFGYDFNNDFQLPLRLEIDTTFRGKGESNGNTGVFEYTDDNGNNDTASVNISNKVRMNTYMVNGYYDFHNQSDFTPYISASIGLANLKLDNHTDSGDGYPDDISKSSNNFAWGLGVGVKYDMTEQLALDLGYKYINGGKVEASRSEDGFSYTSKLKAYSNDIMLGVSYQF